MIEVYSWATPNGHKVHVMLEECGLEYRAIPVNIGAGEQFAPGFLAISPNNKIPAIVDPDGPDGKPISRSCSISPPRPGASCRTTSARVTASSSG
jgi:GST-like protein